jgi:hypothetical protein
MSFAMAHATVVLAVTSFDASAMVIIVVATRDGRALVTSTDAVALFADTAAASLTARRQLTIVGVVRSHLGIFPNAGAPDAVVYAYALMHKTVGHVVEAALVAPRALVVPKRAEVTVVMDVGVVV